jgi:NitT/TauT family transport system ATP-binding protein
VNFTPENMARAESAYRADLYLGALGTGAPAPDDASLLPGAAPHDRFMDGRIFDPDKMQDYVSGFAVRSDRRPVGAAAKD